MTHPQCTASSVL